MTWSNAFIRLLIKLTIISRQAVKWTCIKWVKHSLSAWHKKHNSSEKKDRNAGESMCVSVHVKRKTEMQVRACVWVCTWKERQKCRWEHVCKCVCTWKERQKCRWEHVCECVCTWKERQKWRWEHVCKCVCMWKERQKCRWEHVCKCVCTCMCPFLPTKLCFLFSHNGAARTPLATKAKKAFFT